MYIHIGWIMPVIIITGIIGVVIIGLCVASKRGDKRLEKDNFVILCEECHRKKNYGYGGSGGGVYAGIDLGSQKDITVYHYYPARKCGRSLKLFGRVKKKSRPRWRQIIKAENLARKWGA